MSKMNDMAMTIEELRNAAIAINDAANWLAQQFEGASGTAEKAEDPATPAKPALTLEEVRAILADKSRAGHTAEIRELLILNKNQKLTYNRYMTQATFTTNDKNILTKALKDKKNLRFHKR
uniref:hypothetical protein n=1 Tax=Streptococcus TaxID=1301 RepID=UPI001BB2878F